MIPRNPFRERFDKVRFSEIHILTTASGEVIKECM